MDEDENDGGDDREGDDGLYTSDYHDINEGDPRPEDRQTEGRSDEEETLILLASRLRGRHIRPPRRDPDSESEIGDTGSRRNKVLPSPDTLKGDMSSEDETFACRPVPYRVRQNAQRHSRDGAPSSAVLQSILHGWQAVFADAGATGSLSLAAAQAEKRKTVPDHDTGDETAISSPSPALET